MSLAILTPGIRESYETHQKEVVEMLITANIQALPVADMARFAGAFISRPVAGRLA